MDKYRESARTAELISKLLCDTISPEEEKELTSLIGNSGLGDEASLERLIRQDFNPEGETAGKMLADDVWNAVRKRTTAYSKSRKRTVIGIAAAAVIIIAVALRIGAPGVLDGWQPEIRLAACEPTLELPGGEVFTIPAETEVIKVLEEKPETPEDAILTISVPKGMTYSFTMDDSSKVHLFPETRLKFPRSFNGPTRGVTLEGEAFFEVARDQGRPFVVDAGGVDINVLGTSFNVRSYAGLPNVETALVSGSVEVNGHILVPDQLAIVARADGRVDIVPANGEMYRERTAGMWVFDYLPLGEIMRELGRWFEFDYEFADPALMQKRFRFKLPNTSDFSRISELMEKTGEMKFNVKGNKIVISQ